jgi:cell division control protein 7
MSGSYGVVFKAIRNPKKFNAEVLRASDPTLTG